MVLSIASLAVEPLAVQAAGGGVDSVAPLAEMGGRWLATADQRKIVSLVQTSQTRSMKRLIARSADENSAIIADYCWLQLLALTA